MTTTPRSADLRGWFNRFHDWVYRLLGSERFFYAVAALFTVQALWIALSARYPQAFDEQFHVGLIQFHAEQRLPFFTHQPPGAEIHGAVVRDPSYFYHYLLSLPYRFLKIWLHSVTAQVIVLRLINVGLFISGLFIYRALMRRLGLSMRLVNTTMLFFVLTPIIPLLAANVNYDNLIFPLTGALFLYGVRYMQALERRRRLDVAALMLVLLYGLLAAIVKYTSLPVTVAFAAVLAYVTFRAYHTKHTASEPLQVNWPRRAFMVFGSVIIIGLLGLSLERYGINLARYHALAPACDKVIGVDLCHSYAVWERDYEWKQIYPHPSTWGVVVYPFVWFHRMVFETMFTISSYFDGSGVVQYSPMSPMTVANYTAWVLVIAGLACCAVFFRRLWRQRYLRMLLLVSLFYALILFAKNFSQYLSTGEAVAIHGRYMVPLYPLLYAALAMSFGYLFERFKLPRLKVVLVVISLVFLSQGAGLLTWIYRSDDSWYLSQDPSSAVDRINDPARTVLRHMIIP